MTNSARRVIQYTAEEEHNQKEKRKEKINDAGMNSSNSQQFISI